MVEVINDRTESYLRALRELIAPRLQMVMIVFPTSRDDRYSAVRSFAALRVPFRHRLVLLVVEYYCILSCVGQINFLNKFACFQH